jgi:hypothetical protein
VLNFRGICSFHLQDGRIFDPKTEAVGTIDHIPVFRLKSLSIKMDTDFIERLRSYEHLLRNVVSLH